MRLTVSFTLRLSYPRERGPGTICVEGDARGGDKSLGPAGTRTTNPQQSQTQPRPILNYSNSF
jgi:hypothetical protein